MRRVAVWLPVVLVLPLLLLLLVGGPGAAPPQDSAERDPAASAERAIAKGLAWLQQAQNRRDGSWGCEPGSEGSTGVTGLALLAFMAGGSTPSEGPYSEYIRRGVDFLMRSQNRRTGQITAYDVLAPMGLGTLFDHAAATTALAEASGMLQHDPQNGELRARLQLAARHIDNCQGADGGWNLHGARAGGSHLPTTALAFTALRSAHNAGVTVTANFASALEFTRRCGDGRGKFSEQAGRGNRVTYYGTASGLRILYGVIRLPTDEVRTGLEQLSQMRMDQDYQGRNSEWDYVAAFYAAMALIQENGPFFTRWFEQTRAYLVGKQNADGSWTIEWCASCRAFATALSVLVLECPKRQIPMWDL